MIIKITKKTQFMPHMGIATARWTWWPINDLDTSGFEILSLGCPDRLWAKPSCLLNEHHR